MAEVEALCDRIAILSDGNIIFMGTLAELTEKIGKRYVIHIKTAQGEESFESDNIGDTMLSLLEDFKLKGTEVLDIKVDRGTLEEHFIDIARGNGK
jgi:ABC-2 type transport system ATP-binding protein